MKLSNNDKKLQDKKSQETKKKSCSVNTVKVSLMVFDYEKGKRSRLSPNFV